MNTDKNKLIFVTRNTTALSSDDVLSVCDYALNSCNKLQECHLPNVTYVGTYGFSGCSKPLSDEQLSNLEFVGTNAFSGVTHGNLTCLSLKNLTNSTLKSNTFGKMNSLKVLVADNAKEIEENFIQSCDNIESAYLPNAERIKEYAFSNKLCLDINDVYMPNAFDFGQYAFENTKTISVDFGKYAGFDASEGIFNDCKNLSVVKNEEYLFIVSTPIQEKSYTSIPENLFRNCVKLSSFDFNKTFPTTIEETNITCMFGNVGPSAFYNTALSAIKSENLTSIEDYAFANCRSLSSIELNALTTCKKYAFANDINLSTISLPNTEFLQDHIFDNCANITNLSIEKCTSIKGDTFANCGADNLSIYAPMVSAVLENGFRNCNAEYIELSNDVAILSGNNAFQNCKNLKKICIMPVVQYKYNASMNLWQFIKDFGSTLLYNPNDGAAGVRIGLELPEKYTVKAVKASGTYTFSSLGLNYNNHKNAFMIKPNGVSYGYRLPGFSGGNTSGDITRQRCSISNEAQAKAWAQGIYFELVVEATDIQVEYANEIPQNTFSGCQALTTVELSLSSTEYTAIAIRDNAFANTAISRLPNEEDIVQIGNTALSGNSHLTCINVPNCTHIENDAFLSCNNVICANFDALTSIQNATVNSISSSLQNINISSVEAINDELFISCFNLSNVIADNIVSIGKNAFSNTSLTSYALPKTVEELDPTAFANCKKLVDLSVDPENETYFSDINNVHYPAIFKTENGITKLVCAVSTLSSLPEAITSLTDVDVNVLKGLKTFLVSKNLVQNIELLSSAQNLETLSVVPENARYTDMNGCNVIVEKDTSALVVGCANSYLCGDIAVLCSYAFNQRDALIELVATDDTLSNLQLVQPFAFNNCKNLSNLEIGSSVENAKTIAYEENAIFNSSSKEFYFWINSYGEENCDYTIAYKPNSEEAQISTYEFSRDPRAGINEQNWKKVTYSFDDTALYGIKVRYRKDGSQSYNFDRGYIAIPKHQPFELNIDLNGQWRRVESWTPTQEELSRFDIYESFSNYGKDNENADMIVDVKFAESEFVDLTATLHNVQDLNLGALKCDNLVQLGLPELSAVKDYQFEKSPLYHVKLDKVQSIGNYAFADCSKLYNCEVGPDLTSIGEHAFEACVNLRSFADKHYASIGQYAFAYTGLTGVLDQMQFGAVGLYAGNKGIRALDMTNMPNAVLCAHEFNGGDLTAIAYLGTSLKDCVFANCRNLVSVYMPNLTSVNTGAFSGCTSLETIDLPAVTTVQMSAFLGCHSLTSFNMPNATALQKDAFAYCGFKRIDDTFYPPKMTAFRNAFTYNALTAIELSNVTDIYQTDLSTNTTTIEQIKFDKTKYIYTSAFMNCANITQLNEQSFPKIYQISNSAFRNCTRLAKATINPSSIWDYAFANTALTGIQFQRPSSIGAHAFDSCASLISADLPNCYMFNEYAFFNCQNLLSVVAQSNQLSHQFRNSAFRGCSKLKQIYAPGGKAATVETSAFYGCTELEIDKTKLDFNQLTSIGNYAFTTSKLKEVTGNNFNQLKLLNNAFDGCKIEKYDLLNVLSVTGRGRYHGLNYQTLQSINLPNAIELSDNCFFQCQYLSSANIPKAKNIGHYAFDHSNISAVELLNVQSIGNNAFDSTKLSVVDMPLATTAGAGAFYQCGNVLSANLPKLTAINSELFKYCNKLSSVYAPKAEYVDSNGFGYCSELTELTLPNATSFGNYAFKDCAKLSSIDCSEITAVSYHCFNGCSSLTSLDLRKVSYIGSGAFQNCEKLKSVQFSNMLTGIYYDAFNRQDYDYDSGNYHYYWHITCPALKEVIFQSNLTSIYYDSGYEELKPPASPYFGINPKYIICPKLTMKNGSAKQTFSWSFYDSYSGKTSSFFDTVYSNKPIVNLGYSTSETTRTDI